MTDDTPKRGVLSDLRSALDRLTRPPVATAAAGLMLLLLLGVVGLHLATLEAPGGGNIATGTGDFLAFWTGAVAIQEGSGGSLYDFDAQKALQTRILGGASPEFQPYLNPPLLALLIAPFVDLGFVRAFYVWDLFCVLALAGGLAALARWTRGIHAQPLGTLTLVLAILSFQPMLQTTLGGQNSPLTFALLAGFGLALSRGRTLAAALFLGLLSYKPQYAVGLGLALLMSGQITVAAGGAALGALHWLAGAVFCGARWPLDMLAFMQVYRPMELADNAETHFSLTRVADYLLPSPLDSAVAVAGLLVVLFFWWKYRGFGRRGHAAWLALVVCGTMIVSPHQQFYDAALLTLPVALLIDDGLREGQAPSLLTRVLLALAYAAYPLWDYAALIGFQPLFLVLGGVTAWSLERCRASGPA